MCRAPDIFMCCFIPCSVGFAIFVNVIIFSTTILLHFKKGYQTPGEKM